MKVTDEMVEAAMTVWSRYDKGEERLAMEGAIRAALAAAPPIITPAITADKSPACPHIRSTDEGTHWCALAAAPPRRPTLTDEEIDRITDAEWATNNHKPIYAAHRAYARAVEAALAEQPQAKHVGAGSLGRMPVSFSVPGAAEPAKTPPPNALTAPPQVAAPQAEPVEPVAWRWLSSDGLEWLFVERKEWAPNIKGVEVEPLYAVPPAPDALRKSVPWPEAVPWQGGLSNDELRREWDLRLPGVEPTDRELSAFAVGIEAGHKIVWVHDPDIERLREAARMAHKRVLIALDEPKQTMSDGKALREIVRQLRLMDAELREALGDGR